MIYCPPDFGRTASDYARHRADFHPSCSAVFFAQGTGLYPQWLLDLQSTEFGGIKTLPFDVEVSYSHEAWVGRVRASAPVAATLDGNGVRSCSRELAAMLAERFPEDPLTIPRRAWAVTAHASSTS